jgi:hypothetical protein
MFQCAAALTREIHNNDNHNRTSMLTSWQQSHVLSAFHLAISTRVHDVFRHPDESDRKNLLARKLQVNENGEGRDKTLSELCRGHCGRGCCSDGGIAV